MIDHTTTLAASDAIAAAGVLGAAVSVLAGALAWLARATIKHLGAPLEGIADTLHEGRREQQEHATRIHAALTDLRLQGEQQGRDIARLHTDLRRIADAWEEEEG